MRAVLEQVEPVRAREREGLALTFGLRRARIEVDRVEDFADLGPELTLPAVAGVGKVLRLLRAARVAAPEPAALVGRLDDTRRLVERARDTALALGLRPRSRVRFLAWTDAGVEVVEDVREVRETPDAWIAYRRGGIPVRIPREAVLRHSTETERWYQVVEIERASALRRRA